MPANQNVVSVPYTIGDGIILIMCSMEMAELMSHIRLKVRTRHPTQNLISCTFQHSSFKNEVIMTTILKDKRVGGQRARCQLSQGDQQS